MSRDYIGYIKINLNFIGFNLFILVGKTLYHTTLLASSLQGADPWSNLLWPRSLEDAGWTWDQWQASSLTGDLG